MMPPIPAWDATIHPDAARAVGRVLAAHAGREPDRDPLDAVWRRTRAQGVVVCDACLTRDLDANTPPPLGATPAPNPAPPARALITLEPIKTPHGDYAAGHCDRCGTYYWRPL